MLRVKTEDVAVVCGATGRVGEECVGFGEQRETGGGVGVGGVCVWMVRLGQAVEGSAGDCVSTVLFPVVVV